MPMLLPSVYRIGSSGAGEEPFTISTFPTLLYTGVREVKVGSNLLKESP
jgi:hypothetical protein